MRQVGIAEAKNNLSALLDRVRRGERVLITDRGNPVASIIPAEPDAGAAAGIARLEREGLIRRGSGRAELILTPPPKLKRGASALAALLEDRREGR